MILGGGRTGERFRGYSSEQSRRAGASHSVQPGCDRGVDRRSASGTVRDPGRRASRARLRGPGRAARPDGLARLPECPSRSEPSRRCIPGNISGARPKDRYAPLRSVTGPVALWRQCSSGRPCSRSGLAPSQCGAGGGNGRRDPGAYLPVRSRPEVRGRRGTGTAASQLSLGHCVVLPRGPDPRRGR